MKYTPKGKKKKNEVWCVGMFPFTFLVFGTLDDEIKLKLLTVSWELTSGSPNVTLCHTHKYILFESKSEIVISGPVLSLYVPQPCVELISLSFLYVTNFHVLIVCLSQFACILINRVLIWLKIMSFMLELENF